MKYIGIEEISMNKIHSNVNQPRETFNKEKIEELANSIKEKGLLHPIIIRAFNDGYKIIAGERRYKAFQMLNMNEIPSRIVESDDHEAEIISIVENYHREDLTEEEQHKCIYTAWIHANEDESKNKFKDNNEKLRYSFMAKCTGISERVIKYVIEGYDEKKGNPDSEIIQKATVKDLERTRYLKEISPKSRNLILEKLEKLDDKQNDKKQLTAKDVEDIVKCAKNAVKEGLSVKDVDKIMIKELKNSEYDKNKTPENIKKTLDISLKLPIDLKDKVLNGKIDIEEAKMASVFPTVEQRNQVIQERRILAQKYKEDEQRHITLRKKMSDDVLLGKKPTTISVQFDVRKSNNDISSNRILERYQNIHIEVLSYRSDHIMSIENKDIQDRCINVIKQTLSHCNQVLQTVSEHKSLLLNEKVKGETS